MALTFCFHSIKEKLNTYTKEKENKACINLMSVPWDLGGGSEDTPSALLYCVTWRHSLQIPLTLPSSVG